MPGTLTALLSFGNTPRVRKKKGLVQMTRSERPKGVFDYSFMK